MPERRITIDGGHDALRGLLTDAGSDLSQNGEAYIAVRGNGPATPDLVLCFRVDDTDEDDEGTPLVEEYEDTP